MSGINAGEIKKAAQKQILEERKERAVKLITAKVKEVESARRVLENLEAELEELERDINNRV